MPRSRVRKKSAYTAPPRSGRRNVSPPWVAPLMLTLFVAGVLWLAVFYVTNGDLVFMEDLGNWNLAIGFGLICGGFAVSTQWR